MKKAGSGGGGTSGDKRRSQRFYGGSAVDTPARKTVLGNNGIDDVRWLCSFSESELDLLMGLKNMVHMRAKKIGHVALAKKFDLRRLRALSFIFMEHLKGQLKDMPVTLGFDSNLLKQNLSGSFATMTRFVSICLF